MGNVTVDLAEAYRLIAPVELGRRMRNARVLAGRTQSDAAGDEVTAAYVSRIEAGQRKPEFHLLGRMAGRIGTTSEALLAPPDGSRGTELRVALDYAELELASGDSAAALRDVERVLADVAEDGPYSDIQRAAKRTRALALEATGRLSEAIIALEDIAEEPDRTPGWLRCMIALTRCYCDSGEFDRAIAAGQNTQRTIRELGLEGLTEAIQLSVTIAGVYSMRGDLEQAKRLCMRAASDAEKYDSAIGRASAYWNASIVESKKGAHHSALELARKALAYFEVGDDLRNLARLRGQIAYTLLRMDPPDPRGAIELLDQVANEAAFAPLSPVDRANNALNRARAHFLLGEHAEAIALLDTCDRLVPEEAAVMRAWSLALAAEIAAADGERATAREKLTRAVHILTGIGADRRAAELWFELGTILESTGDTAGALDAFRRAAASSGVQGMPTSSAAIPAK